MIHDNLQGDIASENLLSAHLISLLSHISRKVYAPDNSIARIITKMQTDFSNQLTNEDYARELSISQYHLIRKFKKETGVTQLKYKTIFSVQKAIHLLETTNLNVSEIAHMLGFEDSLYFSCVFKKKTGISTKKYCRRS